MAKTVTVTNFKGGVGKTSITLNLAYELSRRGRRVTLVDLDPQAVLSHSLRTPAGNQEPTLKLQSLAQGSSIANVIAPRELDIEPMSIAQTERDTAWDGIRCVPANLSLQRVKDAVLQNPHVLRFAIEQRMEEPNPPDWVIVDTHPDLDIKVTNAMMAADLVLIPIKFDGAFAEGLRETIEAVERTTGDLRLPLHMEPIKYRVVANAVDTRTGRDRVGMEAMQAILDSSETVSAVIPDTCKVGEASMRGCSVAQLGSRNGSEKAVAAYTQLADDVCEIFDEEV